MINPSALRRGSIWYFDPDPTMGHEQSKRRPCLIISADEYNQGKAGLVVVLPITSKKRELYWHVTLSSQESGLEQLSYIICDQPRAISCQRLSGKMVGFISDCTMDSVEERVKNLLNFF